MKYMKIIITLYLFFKTFLSFVYTPNIDFLISYRYRYLGVFRITAYEHTEISCDYSADERTSLNLKVAPGICAVDPNVIPIGSILYISGLGYFVAGDIGGKIKGNRIDIYIPTVEECRKFGIKYKSVFKVNFIGGNK